MFKCFNCNNVAKSLLSSGFQATTLVHKPDSSLEVFSHSCRSSPEALPLLRSGLYYGVSI